MQIDWTTFKTYVNARLIPIQYIDIYGNYYLKAFDGAFSFSCTIPQDGSSDQTDFETSYKPSANSSPVQNKTNNTFTAKTLIVNGVKKNLFARNTGITANLSPGSNTITYTATYAWAKVVGMEAINALAGDYASMQIYDNHAGTYSGVPDALLNQFGYTLNIAPDYYKRESPFDADLYAGMVMKITYHSETPLLTTRWLGINIIMNEVKT